MKVEFSLNIHDQDGDIFEECIMLHCGDNTILKFKNLDELDRFNISTRVAISEIESRQ